MPAPCAQVMGFYHPFPTPYSSTFQAANTVNAITTECTERPNQLGQAFPLSNHRSRNGNRGPIVPKSQLLQQHIKNKRPQVKNVATQKETSAAGPDSRSKIVLLVDASQQTGKAVLCLLTCLLWHVWRSALMQSVFCCFPSRKLRQGLMLSMGLHALATVSS